MLGAIAIVPSAPVLVPQLAGSAAAELTDLRTAVITAARTLSERWIAVGSGAEDAVFGPDSVGTFAGFGVDLVVGLSARAATPVVLPLPGLIAGWLRGRAEPDARVQVRVYADPESAPARGARLRTEIEQTAEPVGVLVLADGANTLSRAAPGGFQPADIDLQRTLDDALARGDTGALTGLPAQVVGRVGLAVLSGLAGPGPRSTTEFYRGAPYGVGYFAGVWQL